MVRVLCIAFLWSNTNFMVKFVFKNIVLQFCFHRMRQFNKFTCIINMKSKICIDVANKSTQILNLRSTNLIYILHLAITSWFFGLNDANNEWQSIINYTDLFNSTIQMLLRTKSNNGSFSFWAYHFYSISCYSDGNPFLLKFKKSGYDISWKKRRKQRYLKYQIILKKLNFILDFPLYVCAMYYIYIIVYVHKNSNALSVRWISEWRVLCNCKRSQMSWTIVANRVLCSRT